MSPDFAGKKVLVLSDNNGLSRVIEVSLACNRLETFRSTDGAERLEGEPLWKDDLDLIIVALSLPGSEPTAMLARAAMAERIGDVPLLVISEIPFSAGPPGRVAHLDFPFDLDSLYAKVEEVFRNGR